MDNEQSVKGNRPGLRVGVIAGSTRPVRQAKVVAEWVCADPIPSLDLVLIDLADVGLPLLCEPAPAASGQYVQPATIVVAAGRGVRRVRPGDAGVQPLD